MAKELDYKSIIHGFIDPIVTNKDLINIELKEEEKDVTINISSDSNNISRLIGKHGIIASAIREAMSIAGKEGEKFVHIHFSDNDKKEESKVEETPIVDSVENK